MQGDECDWRGARRGLCKGGSARARRCARKGRKEPHEATGGVQGEACKPRTLSEVTELRLQLLVQRLHRCPQLCAPGAAPAGRNGTH